MQLAQKHHPVRLRLPPLLEKEGNYKLPLRAVNSPPFQGGVPRSGEVVPLQVVVTRSNTFVKILITANTEILRPLHKKHRTFF